MLTLSPGVAGVCLLPGQQWLPRPWASRGDICLSQFAAFKALSPSLDFSEIGLWQKPRKRFITCIDRTARPRVCVCVHTRWAEGIACTHLPVYKKQWPWQVDRDAHAVRSVLCLLAGRLQKKPNCNPNGVWRLSSPTKGSVLVWVFSGLDLSQSPWRRDISDRKFGNKL